MAGQTTRKIMRHGTSGVIALPTDYRRYHSLNSGSEVTLLYDGLLVVVPQRMVSAGKVEQIREVYEQLRQEREIAKRNGILPSSGVTMP